LAHFDVLVCGASLLLAVFVPPFLGFELQCSLVSVYSQK
jgi:hypothetical protein